MPLTLVDAQAAGCGCGAGRAARGIRARRCSRRRGWSWCERFALLRCRGRAGAAGFRCDAGDTVADTDRVGLPTRGAARNSSSRSASPRSTRRRRSERRSLSARPARRPVRRRRRRRPAAAAGRPRQRCCPRPAARLARRRRRARSGSAIASTAIDARTARAGASTASRFDRVVSPPARSRPRGSSPRTPPRWAATAARAALRADRHRLRCAAPAAPCPSRCSRSAPAMRSGRRNSSSIAASSAAPPGLLAFVISGAAALGRARHRSARRRRRCEQA